MNQWGAMLGAKMLLAIALLWASTVSADVRLQQADRKIQLQSQFARISETLKFKNIGAAAVNSLTLCALTALAEKAAYCKVSDTSSGQTVLQVRPAATPANAPAGVSCWEAALKTALPPGELATLQVETVLAEVQTPYPAEILQTEAQLVVYLDNVYIVSPYLVSAQITEVVLASTTVKSYTDTEKPVSKSGSTVRYGRYDKVEPFTMKPMRLHYENLKPFRTVPTLLREITVSHWGNIYVEESYILKHTGAKLTGAFSRHKFAHQYNGRANSYQDLKAHFPVSAHHTYYTDLIGNISTSNVRKTGKETLMDFKTRYPLLGGWKCDFVLGYSTPLEGFLFKKKSDGQFRLSVDYSTSLEDVFVQDMVVRVVLPEGAADIKWALPVDNVEASFDIKATYLDTTGRPVLVLHSRNMVPEHASLLQVDYTFSPSSMMREPMLLISVFAALFALAMIYTRLELTISRDDKWKEVQGNQKLSTVMQQISTLVAAQHRILEKLSVIGKAVRVAEDADKAVANRADLEKQLKEVDEKLKPLMSKLEASKGLSSRVRELLDKAKGVQGQVVKLLGERVDLIKKGTPVLEVNQKLQATTTEIQDTMRDLKEQAATLFALF